MIAEVNAKMSQLSSIRAQLEGLAAGHGKEMSSRPRWGSRWIADPTKRIVTAGWGRRDASRGEALRARPDTM